MSKRILMMGGTQFVGRTFTQKLRADGHQVTHFNRGKTNPDAFPNVQTITGDRNESLDAIAAQEWDAVIDVNAYYLHQTERLNAALNQSLPQFIFISTISVYDQGDVQRLPEDGPLRTLPEGSDLAAELSNENYGAYKVLCERAILDHWGDRATILRPGVIIGPHDHTDRFAFWPHRIAEGGEMIVPSDVNHSAITGLDARDFADFLALCLDQNLTGTYNIDKANLSFGDLRQAMQDFAAHINSDVTQVEIPIDHLVERGAYRWSEFPCLLPDDASLGNTAKANAAGLKERPLLESFIDTYEWIKATNRPRPEKTGLSVQREQDIIKQWRESQQS
jgi:2'-hydroxyisoflavone reductase